MPSVSELRNKVSDEVAKGVYFGTAAETSNMVVANNALLQGLTNFTVEAMIKIGKTPTLNNVLVGYYVANTGFQLYIDTLNRLVIQVGNGTTNTVFDSGTNKVDVNGWVHVAAEWDYSNNLVRTFIKGVQVNTAGLAGGNTGNPAASLYVGNNAGFNRIFQGVIQEVRISNIARYTASGYTPSKRQFTADANTIALWHMDDGTGTSVADSSGNTLTGTLAGTPAPQWSGGYLLKTGSTTRSAV